jgi:MFS superfamily sulfate permease-like transporter
MQTITIIKHEDHIDWQDGDNDERSGFGAVVCVCVAVLAFALWLLRLGFIALAAVLAGCATGGGFEYAGPL